MTPWSLAMSVARDIAFHCPDDVADARDQDLISQSLIEELADGRSFFAGIYPAHLDVYDSVLAANLLGQGWDKGHLIPFLLRERGELGGVDVVELEEMAVAWRRELTFIDAQVEPTGGAIEARLQHLGVLGTLRAHRIVWEHRLVELELTSEGLDGLVDVNLAPQRGLSGWLARFTELNLGVPEIDDAWIIHGADDDLDEIRTTLVDVGPALAALAEDDVRIATRSFRVLLEGRRAGDARAVAAFVGRLAELWRRLVERAAGLR